MEERAETCNCAALRQAARRVTRLYDEAVASLGLGANQCSILSALQEAGPSTVQDLARRLVMDRSTLGHLLRPLEARGLLRIEGCADDARCRIVTPTAAGRETVSKGRPLWAAAQRRFERTLGPETARELRGLLARVITADFGG